MNTPKQRDFYDFLGDDPSLKGMDDAVNAGMRRLARQKSEKPRKEKPSIDLFADDFDIDTIELANDAFIDDDLDREKAFEECFARVEDRAKETWAKKETQWPETFNEIAPILAARASHMEVHVNKEWLSNRLKEVAQNAWKQCEATENQKVQKIAAAIKVAPASIGALLAAEGVRVDSPWNRAVRTLPSDAKRKIAAMFTGKKREMDKMNAVFDSNKRTRAELGFTTPETTWTWQLQKVVDDNTWLKDIDQILKEEKMDFADRGKFWSQLLIK